MGSWGSRFLFDPQPSASLKPRGIVNKVKEKGLHMTPAQLLALDNLKKVSTLLSLTGPDEPVRRNAFSRRFLKLTLFVLDSVDAKQRLNNKPNIAARL